MGWILLTLIMLGIAGIVTWAILSALPKTAPLVSVPNVQGKTLADARAALEAVGLNGEVVDQKADNTVPPGSVISQDPVANEKLAKGKSVRLVISQGPSIVPVPDVKGKTLTEARTAIESVGLVVGTVTHRNSTSVAKDHVISQSPDPAVDVRAGTKINLSVSDGPKKVPVPTVLGESEAQAKSDLVAAGFKVTVVRSSQGDCAFTPGRVCDQNPSGGTPADEGTVVVITVGEGVTESPTPTPTET
jgi:serine/threonine-protein kinase